MNSVETHRAEALAERRAAAAVLCSPVALTTWAAAQHTSVARAEFNLLQELTTPSAHFERSEHHQQQQQQQAPAPATAAAQREASPPPLEQQQAEQAAQQRRPEEAEHRDIGMDPYQFEELDY